MGAVHQQNLIVGKHAYSTCLIHLNVSIMLNLVCLFGHPPSVGRGSNSFFSQSPLERCVRGELTVTVSSLSGNVFLFFFFFY